MMADSDNYIFPSKLRTEMLINESNGLDLRYGRDYDFGIPKASYGVGLRYNTSLVLTFKGRRRGIKERVLYRRLSLDLLRKHIDPPVIKLDAISFTTSDILSALNSHYGTALELDELVNETYVANPAVCYECKVSNTSLAWNDGVLLFSIDNRTQILSDVLPVIDLNGLYPPISYIV